MSSVTAPLQVCVLGLGHMGSAIAMGISAGISAGPASGSQEVVVWNRSAGVAEKLADRADVRVASSPREAVVNADIVICTFSDGQATEDVLLDEGLRPALKPGVVVCDMGTSGVATARRLDQELAWVRFVDAPVSGSVATIEAGQLLVMASGDAGGIDLLEQVTRTIARKVVRLGSAGQGQAMKLAVNLVVYNLNAALSEALSLAAHAGVEPETAYGVFAESVIAAPFVLYKRPAFLDAATPVTMSLGLVRKDLELITSYAAALGSRARVTDMTFELVKDACTAGHASEDMAALGRFLRTSSTNDNARD